MVRKQQDLSCLLLFGAFLIKEMYSTYVYVPEGEELDFVL